MLTKYNQELHIRAPEIQKTLNCSKQYAYNIMNMLNPVSLAYTSKQPPKAVLRSDFKKWLSDNKIDIEFN